ncbi:MAG: outer membrane protein assembly factor BamA [Alteromonadaceae bacterium]|nr:MAG: outer membrane protein assembly factor BamA [Alteromonadaceae bacterium]
MKFVITLLVLLGFASYAHALTFKVTDIRLEGLQRVSASPVFAALPLQVGDVIDDEDVRESIRSLFFTGFFSDVQIARDGGILIVTLKERPAIKSIEIDGNKAIKTEQLTEVMTDNGLAEGEILELHTLQGITRELERQYIAQARYGASVESEVIELPNSLVDIKIEVDEGKAAKIRHINIVGNDAYDDKELLDLFESGVSNWKMFFSSKDKYAKEKLTGDIEALESYYLDRGYLDFKVTSTQISVSPDKTSIYVTLNVYEGEIYKVKKVDLAGDPILPEPVVMRLILLKDGQDFSQGRMKATSEYIKTLLGNAGYTNATVEGNPRKNDGENTVDVTFFIDPGKRVYVRRIEFSGNTKTKDDVLRREMRQLEGASASNASIESSKIRLERLGFFKEVNVETEDVPGFTDLIDVKYTVEEQPSGSISASVGFADQSGLILGLSVSENNWMGSGKRVSFGATRNRFQTDYNFSYTDPYFTPDGVSRGFSAFFQEIDYSKIGINGQDALTNAGFNVTFGYPISEISFLNYGFGVITQSVSASGITTQVKRQSPSFFDSDASVVPVEFAYVSQADAELAQALLSSGTPQQEFQLETRAITDDMIVEGEPGFLDLYGDKFNSASVNLSWSRRTLNRGVMATRGNSQSLRFEAMLPGSDLEFFKFTYEAQTFLPLTRNLTLRFRTKLGYGDGYGGMRELPYFEAFRSGGFGSVRGYERFTLGPIDSPLTERYRTVETGWTDLNNNGVRDPSSPEVTSLAYVLCDGEVDVNQVRLAGQLGGIICNPGQLQTTQNITSLSTRSRRVGGDILTEFSTELILPIPFIKDTRSMQLAAFVDAGNVFSTRCLENQSSCHDVDLGELKAAYGFGFTWISGFGPLTFSISKPINEDENDDTKFFDFTFGTGF